MSSRENISTGAPWEAKVGYSRAVRVGPHVWVTGTVAVGEQVSPDPYIQTKRCLEIIQQSLERLGARTTDVVRNRAYVTDISQFEEIGKAHFEMFGDIRPCLTMVEVSRLISPEYLVEIETEAYVV